MGKKFLALILALMGFLFISAYIRACTCDVVYTDYIRLVNSYLNDVYSFKPYLGADIFTRMPITYLQRIINVRAFAYSTLFDMMLGAAFLSASVFFILYYAAKRGFSYTMLLILALIGFSLNKWEMLINGSGWVHFMAFALFFYHFYIYDRGTESRADFNLKLNKKNEADRRKLIILPYIMLLVSGPYILIYAFAMSAVYMIKIIVACKDLKKIKASLQDKAVLNIKLNTIKADIKFHIIYFINIFIPTAIYVYSRANSVEEHAGATQLPITQVIASDPLLLIRLLLKSLASVIFDNEVIKKAGISNTILFITGIAVGIFYIYALYLNFYKGVFKASLLPACLLFAGIAAHLLVVMSRWIFLKDSYAMSSRYALQFQSGTLGILLSLYLNKIKRREDLAEESRQKSRRAKIAVSSICLCLIMGNLLTCSNEIQMSVYRKENFAFKKAAALNYNKLSDKKLKEIFQYHDSVRIRKAFKILQEKKLNVFRTKHRK